MTYRLTDGDLRTAEQAARRFQGTWWQGTSGTLAAWLMLLIKERRMDVEGEPVCTNAMAPEAVEAAWAAVKARHQQTLENIRRAVQAAPVVEDAETLRPGSREFLAVLDELRDLHLRKTLDYGVDEDALSNIRSSADIVGMLPWAGCVLRMMDKMHRLKSFFRRGRTEFDGVEDTLKDIACYAAIALVLYREANCTKVQ